MKIPYENYESCWFNYTSLSDSSPLIPFWKNFNIWKKNFTKPILCKFLFLPIFGWGLYGCIDVGEWQAFQRHVFCSITKWIFIVVHRKNHLWKVFLRLFFLLCAYVCIEVYDRRSPLTDWFLRQWEGKRWTG